jgi:ribosomal protein S18 acetylase RimI-like enzyme
LLGLTVRWLSRVDIPKVLALAESRSEPWMAIDNPTACVDTTDTAGLVAEVESQIVGYIIYQMQRQSRAIVIRNLFVATSWRRKGIGRKLLENLEEKLSQGYQCITVHVPESESDGLAFFQDAGYTTSSALDKHWTDISAHVLVRQVSPNVFKLMN